MMEPKRRLPRRMCMNRSLWVPVSVVVALLSVAGCGQVESNDVASKARTVAGCPSDSPALRQSQAITSWPVAGVDYEVRMTEAAASECRNSLLVTRNGDLVSALPLGDVRFAPEAITVITPSASSSLLVAREVHPRGGYQIHLYGLHGERVTEVLHRGNPVVPFVATDSSAQPTSADCTDNGVAVTRAVAHEPPGVMMAYDVRRTVYSVTGKQLSSREIADNVLPGRLPKRFPELARSAMFVGC